LIINFLKKDGNAMTLITRIPATHSNTLLPRITKDPVLPLFGQGTRLLVDMKSANSWPSQESSITTSDQVLNIADTTPAWPTLEVAGTHTYNSTRGGLQGNASATSGLWLSDTSTGIFNNALHSWAFTLWLFRGAITTGTTFSMFADHAVSFAAYATSAAFEMNIRGASGTGNSEFLAFSPNSLNRVGFTVYQDASFQWKYRTVTGSQVSTTEKNLAGATNTEGGAGLRASASATTRPRIFGNAVPADFFFYRTYAENLTLSGRTFQQVFDADWARGNGRFS
jgi:hypothetical protein